MYARAAVCGFMEIQAHTDGIRSYPPIPAQGGSRARTYDGRERLLMLGKPPFTLVRGDMEVQARLKL